MTPPFILFDFDGVIADSFRPAFESIKVIHPCITEDHYRQGFEGNIYSWAEDHDAHDERCRHELDFFSVYLPRMRKEVGLMPQMAEVVGALAEKYTLIIISSTTTEGITHFLEKYNLSSHFTEILGGDVHPSKVEKIKMVFDKYHTSPETCVFITDTLGDIKEGRVMGVKSIAVTWGFHKPKTLAKGEPVCLVDTPEQLQTAISTFFTV